MKYHTETRLRPALVIGDIELVTSLGKAGIPILLGSENGKNPVMYSKYGIRRFTFSSYDSNRFVEELCCVGRDMQKKPVLISNDHRAIAAISYHRERLEKYYSFLLPPEKIVADLIKKQNIEEPVEDDNILIPLICKTFQGDRAESMKPALKPAIDNILFENLSQGDLNHSVTEVCSGVVTREQVTGNEYDHYVSNLFLDKEGNIRGYYIAQRQREYPDQDSGGRDTCIITVENQEVLELSLSVADKLGLKGLVRIEFKKDRISGNFILAGVYPCSNRSLLGMKSGANLAYLYYMYVQNFEANPVISSASPGVKCIDLIRYTRVFTEYYRNGKISFGEWRESLSGDYILSGLSAQDLFPCLMKLWADLTKGNKYRVSRKQE
ncbi:MAG: hypothetical protein WD604_13940 [Balneolaceae bacterium]